MHLYIYIYLHQSFQCSVVVFGSTPPKVNSKSSQKWWLKDEISFLGWPTFWGELLNFQGGSLFPTILGPNFGEGSRSLLFFNGTIWDPLNHVERKSITSYLHIDETRIVRRMWIKGSMFCGNSTLTREQNMYHRLPHVRTWIIPAKENHFRNSIIFTDAFSRVQFSNFIRSIKGYKYRQFYTVKLWKPFKDLVNDLTLHGCILPGATIANQSQSGNRDNRRPSEGMGKQWHFRHKQKNNRK